VRELSIDRVNYFTEISIVIGVVLILLVMIVPIPSWLLDILIALNIALSVLVLLTTFYTRRPLEFSAFPTVLLILTLFRLSLNVASTRRILLYGNMGTSAAGHIIEAFGQFVVGGNYVVGFVVFLILVIINFVVITRGASRIAEVAARFTLDAMPGKQMAIDADLNAGIINEEEARRRRAEIEREADFYGAMDGASKFVKGDAIAGLIIVFINIIGGIVIGVLYHKMDITGALSTYTILTIGDGLVTQIPALMLSTSAGIIVSRSAQESQFSRDIINQLTSYSKSLYLSSIIALLMSFVPGFPFFPFMLLSIAFFTLARVASRKEMEERKVVEEKRETPEEDIERAKSSLVVDPLELELGYTLVSLVDSHNLVERIKTIRRQLAQDLGFILPPVRIRDNVMISPNSYRILIYGTPYGEGEVYLGRLLAIPGPGVSEEIEGIKVKEPAFGVTAYWIDENMREKAVLLGYTVVDPATVIITHLSEMVKRYAYEIISRDDVRELVETLRQSYPRLVDDLVPNVVSYGLLLRVLQNLLREGFPIRNLKKILEVLGDYAQKIDDIEVLTELVRQALSRQVILNYLTPDKFLPVILFDPTFEKSLIEKVTKTERGSYLTLDRENMDMLLNKISVSLEEALRQGYQPVLVVSYELRSALFKFVDSHISRVPVFSHLEIPQDVRIKVVSVVR
jgi:flagellar biosynthesis protein FlhA